MTGTAQVDVVVVGAGPVGLTAALELRRRDVDVLVLDKLLEPPRYAKAVGIQPRTLELWDAMGVVRPALDAATTLRGQLVFRNGELVTRLDLVLPDDVPYRFAALPQYETERILAAALAEHGTRPVRGAECTSFAQDADGVSVTVREADGSEVTVRARYLVGADGAHSTVRKGLGADFTGGAFAEAYMLADVEVDWHQPPGYGIRATHERDGDVDDVLVCIPLPGRGRYRMSMLVDPELAPAAPARPSAGAARPSPGTDGGSISASVDAPREAAGATADGDRVEHGFEGGRAPTLTHVQRVLDRLAPEPTTAGSLRWSSVFRISHRLTDRYSDGRVFLVGDAAHIHPPTGAQGMNTGVQDAVNLGWKLALQVHGRAAPGLLESYHAERWPIGADVVGRTVHDARTGFGTDTRDLATLLQREAQLLLGYPDSPVVGEDAVDGLGGPRPGQRAPDATGLRQDLVAGATRVHELFRHPGHTLLVWARGPADLEVARAVVAAQPHRADVRTYVVTAVSDEATGVVLHDADGRFAAAWGADGVDRAAWVVRPDGYVGFRTGEPSPEVLAGGLSRTLTG